MRRSAKDFAESDRIRAVLDGAGGEAGRGQGRMAPRSGGALEAPPFQPLRRLLKRIHSAARRRSPPASPMSAATPMTCHGLSRTKVSVRSAHLLRLALSTGMAVRPYAHSWRRPMRFSPWRGLWQRQAYPHPSKPWSNLPHCREKVLTWPLAYFPTPCAVWRRPVQVLEMDPVRLDPTAQTHQEGYDRSDQEYDEKNLRNAGCADRDSTETEKCGNQRNDKKDDGIVKHVAPRINCSCSYLRVAESMGNASWQATVGGATVSRRRITPTF